MSGAKTTVPRWLNNMVSAWSPRRRFLLMPLWLPIAVWSASLTFVVCGAICFGTLGYLKHQQLLPEHSWSSIAMISGMLASFPIVGAIVVMILRAAGATAATVLAFFEHHESEHETLKDLLSPNSEEPWNLP